MDLVTQGILGAAVGQAGFQHKLGRKAVLWGGIYGMLPDLDVLVKFSGNPFAEQLYHRGFTHSLFFAPLVAPIAAILMRRLYKTDDYWSWMWLIFWALITHPLLDVFTHYGTQLLNPVSNYRFSLGAIPVVDLLYSVPLLIVVILGLIIPWDKLVRTLTSFVLLLTTSYLFYGISCNSSALQQARDDLGDSYRLESYPTLFQIHLRRVVAHSSNDVKIGLVTTYPGAKYPIQWFSYRDDAEKSADFMKLQDVQMYLWFCAGECLIQRDHHSIKLYDLRFGMPGAAEPGIWGIESVDGGHHVTLFRSSLSSLYKGKILSWVYDVMNCSFGDDPKKLLEKYRE
ncbi:MAG: metal-dependent hydrolase [Candidatus Paracaedibacteraceae bacterium]|nr:metal-dependent hydrolase [Candidatus Paracaedibacteraceae bacterium]